MGLRKIGSKAEYARSRKARALPGGTRQAVQKAVDSARIQLTPDGKVDFAAADAAWLGNTSTLQQSRGAGGGVRSSAVVIAGPDAEPEEYLAARARKEAALADLAEMEAAELRGETVRVGELSSCWGEIAASVRARFLVLPSMAAPLVAVPGRVAEAQATLTMLVNEALSELADGVPESAKRRQARHAQDSPAAT